MKNVLVIGSGGREHAIVWKLKQSSQVGQVFVLPGNAGIGQIAELTQNLFWEKTDQLLSFIQDHQIEFVAVGPEVPLTKGLVDTLTAHGIKTFGPSAQAAQLEGSKIFCKDFLKRHGIPTASYQVFTEFVPAQEYLYEQFSQQKNNPDFKLVIKADGLAAGKGVIIAKTENEAVHALNLMMAELAFGDAGRKVVIEECLVGKEVSLLAFCDGKTIAPMVPAQDYKRALDHDEGLNTGGMGCISPSPIMTPELQELIMQSVMIPTMEGLQKDGIEYKGVIYAGLMIVDGKPIVLEYNCRFGDPETQVILPRLKTDLLDIMTACVDGTLGQMTVEWDTRAAVCVVLASGGYPGAYKKDIPITGLDHFPPQDATTDKIIVFHAGTDMTNGTFVTHGGRVLNMVALEKDIPTARDKVYRAIRKIHFSHMHHRNDIGVI